MIMATLFSKLLLPLGVAGLLAATEIPNGYLQLGIAGASLLVLVTYMKINAKERKDMLDAHSKSVSTFESFALELLKKINPDAK
jgi:hypothetical protein